MKTLLSLSLLCLASICTSVACAEERAPLQNAIAGMEAMSTTNCARIQKDLAKAKAEGTWKEEMQQGYHSLCECMPTQLKVLRSSLTPAVLQSPVSEKEFQSLLLDRVFGKCAAEQMRTTYTGAACTKRFAQVRPDSQKYCSCMLEKLAALPNREVAEIGIAASDYVPLAADAKENGLPPPQPPPAMKRFMETERVCSAP